ncbi:hypothetical protein [Paenarthrobacter nicotinovorans]|uniref:hypothetical protein n=1 Tax=Paenarthrobacter nicotinovorans TaxID=29320 RepID=UPI003D6771C0
MTEAASSNLFFPHMQFPNVSALDDRQQEIVNRWDTFPIADPPRLNALKPPEEEPTRHGAGGQNCSACTIDESQAIWSNENWIVTQWSQPRALPSMFVAPRAHHDLPDLPLELSSQLGAILQIVVNAVAELDGIERAHVEARGDGGEHLHWFILGRPTGALQLRGTFLPLWDMLLPPLPEAVWKAVAQQVRTNILSGHASLD